MELKWVAEAVSSSGGNFFFDKFDIDKFYELSSRFDELQPDEKSQYKVFTGILIYKSFTFVPSISSYLETDKLSDFIKYIDIEEALNYATENANNLFEAYKTFESNPVEVSARELISILKKVGYKLQLKTDDQLDVIESISDETSNEKSVFKGYRTQ